MTPWPTQPGLARIGTAPGGLRPFLLVLILACGLAAHFHRRPALAPAIELPTGDHADIVGKAWVIDGDTLDISRRRIRLLGIDAPESEQNCTDGHARSWPCGRAATREIRNHIAGRQLACQSAGLDRYRRVLAVCALPDGSDVNAWMVQQGWALAYDHYSTRYQPEEVEAQAAKRGIWTGTFVAPWEWRHRHED